VIGTMIASRAVSEDHFGRAHQGCPGGAQRTLPPIRASPAPVGEVGRELDGRVLQASASPCRRRSSAGRPGAKRADGPRRTLGPHLPLARNIRAATTTTTAAPARLPRPARPSTTGSLAKTEISAVHRRSRHPLGPACGVRPRTCSSPSRCPCLPSFSEKVGAARRWARGVPRWRPLLSTPAEKVEEEDVLQG